MSTRTDIKHTKGEKSLIGLFLSKVAIFHNTYRPKCKLLTGALVEYVKEGSVWHVVGDDDGVRGWRCLTSSKHGQNVWMRKDPIETRQDDRERDCEIFHFKKKYIQNIKVIILATSVSFSDDKERTNSECEDTQLYKEASSGNLCDYTCITCGPLKVSVVAIFFCF